MTQRSDTARTACNPRVLVMVMILVALWSFFRWQVGDFYLHGESIAKLSRDMATWTILAAGMTLVIVSGNIDLSVGSLMALCVGTCAFLLDPADGLGLSAAVAVPAALGLGLLLGLMQGACVAWLRMPAFIVTLAGMFIFRGFTQLVSARDPRVPSDDPVLALGFAYIPPGTAYVIAGAVALALVVTTTRRRRSRTRAGLPAVSLWQDGLRAGVPALLMFLFVAKTAEYRGVPAQTLVMAIVLALVAFVATQTRFGRHVFAVGGNATAARLSGVRVEGVTLAVFGLMGLLAGVAGVVWMAQNQGATQSAGEWYELYAIAACVIGGTSLMGGRGSVFGAFLGALVMATVIQGMDYTGLPNWLQLVVRGAVLAAAVAIDVAGKDPAPWMRRLDPRRPDSTHKL